MIKEFKLDNKNIQIHYKDTELKELPVVVLNTFGNEGEAVYNKCIEIKCKEFILVSISNLDWNNDMTPWYAPKLNKNDADCLGKADDYLKVLVHNIVPVAKEYIEKTLNKKIQYFAISGYSLGGLFAIYSAYKTNIFTRIASASGSFWFPKFIEFAKENKLQAEVEKIYFSLGNKESKVKNKALATVQNNTKELEKLFDDKGIKTIYEENEGNHFQNADLRMAKGIKWILE